MRKLDEILGAVYRRDVSALEHATPAEVNASDEDRRPPLMHAVLAEHADPLIVRLLIERGADVNVADKDQKWTALHFAARDQKEPIVRALLEAGAKVDPVDVFGNTPLWRAVSNASPNLDVVKELLAHGADPFKKSKSGVAPIDIARDMERSDLVALFEGRPG
jgi:ankyrin repeat protein